MNQAERDHLVLVEKVLLRDLNEEELELLISRLIRDSLAPATINGVGRWDIPIRVERAMILLDQYPDLSLEDARATTREWRTELEPKLRLAESVGYELIRDSRWYHEDQWPSSSRRLSFSFRYWVDYGLREAQRRASVS